MAKDYAKHNYKRSPKQPINWKRVMMVVIGGVATIVVVLFFSFRMAPLFSNNPAVSAFAGRLKATFSKHTTDKQLAKPAAEPEVHFSFYNELATIRVEPSLEDTSKVAAPAPRQPAPIASAPTAKKEIAEATAPEDEGDHYVIQFATFKEAAGASQLRLSLLLTGVETEIKKIQNEQQESVYRVQQGPYATLAQAKAIQQKWQRKGIDSVLKKID